MKKFLNNLWAASHNSEFLYSVGALTFVLIVVTVGMYNMVYNFGYGIGFLSGEGFILDRNTSFAQHFEGVYWPIIKGFFWGVGANILIRIPLAVEDKNIIKKELCEI